MVDEKNSKTKIINSFRKRASRFTMMGYLSLGLIAGLFGLAFTIYTKAEYAVEQGNLKDVQTNMDDLRDRKRRDSLAFVERIEELESIVRSDSFQLTNAISNVNGMATERNRLQSYIDAERGKNSELFDSLRDFRSELQQCMVRASDANRKLYDTREKYLIAQKEMLKLMRQQWTARDKLIYEFRTSTYGGSPVSINRIDNLSRELELGLREDSTRFNLLNDKHEILLTGN